jgi:hypothetical protein
VNRANEPWEDLEYRELFARFPLDGTAPSGDGAASLGQRLGRSKSAIVAQWDDARTYCRGSTSSVASDGLKSYLDSSGLCG